jgi:hypothetical protein
MTSVSIVWICLDTVWMTKVPPHLIGRVKSTSTALDSILGTATLLAAGGLADRLFEPLLRPGGPLAGSMGALIGVGPGRGVALLLILSGLLALLLAAIALLNPRVRLLEDTLPDIDVKEYVAGQEALVPGV